MCLHLLAFETSGAVTIKCQLPTEGDHPAALAPEDGLIPTPQKHIGLPLSNQYISTLCETMHQSFAYWISGCCRIAVSYLISAYLILPYAPVAKAPNCVPPHV